MKPDRSNYEIWLTAWFDGKLTGSKAEEFRSFLEENPDLKEEAEFLSHSRLIPGQDCYPERNRLKKTVADLTQSQVEYLSVAYLENELTPEQNVDLKQKIDQDKESRVLFDIVQRIKLTPSPDIYRFKNRLKKPVPGARIIKLSLAGLSVAATVALVILSYTFIPGLFSDKRDISTLSNTSQPEPPVIVARVLKSPVEETARPVESDVEVKVQSIKPTQATINELAVTEKADSSSFFTRVALAPIRIDTMPAFNFNLKPVIPGNSLLASKIEVIDISYEDDRNKLSKFLARVFREKILKEEPGSDAPLKAFDFAVAGIEGLNKLFGFEMALVKVNDEGGDLKSIYFSSRNLKFNAPVRKSDATE